ncbi:MAG: type II secretion system protein [Campylobacterota bacterium]|nr:type II secretion system protein [Campylobacterota bacterium]
MRAFTLIELIFVIVIIGIMVGVGASAFKPTYLTDDVNYIHSKIQEAQFHGIGYEHLNFDGTVIADAQGCIELTNSALKDDNYKLHVETFDYGTICFDSKGRPHEDTYNGPLLARNVLNFVYSGENRSIIIEPISGYAIIKYN